MRYFKQYKDSDKVFEVTKEQAQETLTGYWDNNFLKAVFEKEKMFRLYTAYSYVWTKDDNGNVPVPGFFGVCGVCE